ncbi:Mariner Mos1 transposase [Araneus ventricosus]|uniref:Mariner Mos1 transposase n=1 Tax=Araneus ventricosus TaxID=182803 RepID=A0A4Y2C436_ARAVE|nr:Mariner Mos1 transposase [Araneus ventricosus]
MRTSFTTLDVKCSKDVHRSDIRTQNHGDIRAINVTSLHYCGEHVPSQDSCECWFKRFRKRPWKEDNAVEPCPPGPPLASPLIVKRPQWAIRQDRVILFHDNASPHTTKLVNNKLKDPAWEILTHPPYSPDLAPSDLHLFRSMAHSLSQQHFRTYDDVVRWITDWFASKEAKFNWDGIHTIPDRWGNSVARNDHYFE